MISLDFFFPPHLVSNLCDALNLRYIRYTHYNQVLEIKLTRESEQGLITYHLGDFFRN